MSVLTGLAGLSVVLLLDFLVTNALSADKPHSAQEMEI